MFLSLPRTSKFITYLKKLFKTKNKVELDGISVDQDMINELPDSLLISIISRLPAKQAVATSVICRRWKTLWLCGGELEEFSISREGHSCKLLNMSNLKEATKLKLVELRDFMVGSPLSFYGCVNLQTLKLMNIDFGFHPETLDYILFYCANLENLFLDCETEEYGNILNINMNLKFLEIRMMWGWNTINITGDDLRVLKLDQVQSYYVSIDCPFVNELSLYNETHPEQVSDILKVCCTDLDLQESGETDRYNCTHMNDLRVLCTSLDLNHHRDRNLLDHIFLACPNLHEIHIKNAQNSDPSGFNDDYLEWRLNPLNFTCEGRKLPNTLRVVKISKFRGYEDQLDYISYILENAFGLEKLVIECSDVCSKGGAVATLDLLPVPKASINASIDLLPGRWYVANNPDYDFHKWMATLKEDEAENEMD